MKTPDGKDTNVPSKTPEESRRMHCNTCIHKDKNMNRQQRRALKKDATWKRQMNFY